MLLQINIRYILVFFILINELCAFSQGGKKREALKKINTIAQAEAFIKKNGPTSARMGNFTRIIDSIEYKEIKATFRVGDIFYDKRATYKILANEEEPLTRCQYILFDGHKMSKNKIDSLRILLLKQHNSGFPFKSLVKQFSLDSSLNAQDSGWFRKDKMGELFFKELSYRNIGDMFLFDYSDKKEFYVVLKTHEVLCADSWVFIAM